MVYFLFPVLVVAVVAPTVAHALLTKREVRASIGWVGLILSFPLVGAVLYWIFGVNRIQRRAKSSGGELGSPATARAEVIQNLGELGSVPAMPPSRLAPIAYLVGRIVGMPLTGGNAVSRLVNGEEAYPKMLAAIRRAEHSVGLCSYIFDDDSVGQRFIEELVAARGRGVEVRVLVDSVGAKYSRRSVVSWLRRLGVQAASFMPGSLPFRWPYMNLRTHRKILTIDGQVAYLGGMNLREGHNVQLGRNPTQDVHFEIQGPVVHEVQAVFTGDWAFTTREKLTGAGWFPEIVGQGDVLARVIPDGPDEDLDKIRWTILGALANASDSIRIQTPYFLPDTDMITALQVAALRGVQVEVLLPAKGNLRVVQWACNAQLWQILEHGVHVSFGAPPFDHSKLFLVDGRWALVGSANWDLRSLRLNFEIGMELYDQAIVSQLDSLFEQKLGLARAVTEDILQRQPLWSRLRDSAARLALPYL